MIISDLIFKYVIVIGIIIVFAVSSYYNFAWVIRQWKTHNVYLWIKVYNGLVSVLWVFAYTHVLFGFAGINSDYDHAIFSETVLRPLNLITGGALACGAIARMKIAEYIRRM